MQISAKHQGAYLQCVNKSPDAAAAGKHSGLLSEACPGLLCVRPRLCCVAQCGNAALHSHSGLAVRAGVKGKDITGTIAVHLTVKMLGTAGIVLCSLTAAIYRLWL